MGTPNTWIMLCKGVNLRESDGETDTLYFASNTDRYNFMLDHAIVVNPNAIGIEQKRLSNQMYKRISDTSVRVNVSMYDLVGVDYMVMRNFDSNNEQIYYYCFVDDIEYVNEEVSNILFHEDIYQTWIDEAVFQKTEIERRTTSSDVIFDEAHDTPDYAVKGVERAVYTEKARVYDGQGHQIQSTHGKYIVMCLSNALYIDDDLNIARVPYYKGSMNAGRPDQFYYYIAKVSGGDGLEALYNLATRIVSSRGVPDSDYSEALVSLYMAPELCLPDSAITYADAETPVVVVPDSDETLSIPGWTVIKGFPVSAKASDYKIRLADIKTHLFGGYSPKNKKMYNGPYWYLRIKNNTGGYVDLIPQLLRNVDFETPQTEANIAFGARILGTMGSTQSVVLFAQYDDKTTGTAQNSSQQLAMTSYPSVALTSNQFWQFYTQSFSQGSMIFGVLGGIMKAAESGSAGGAVKSVVNDVATWARRSYDTLNSAPTVVGDRNSDSSVMAFGNDEFVVEVRSMSKADAEANDNYFSRYGYHIGRMENVAYGMNSRPYWNYTQTNGIVIKGNMPLYAQKAIEKMYDNGVRVWTPANYMDYSKNNSPT